MIYSLNDMVELLAASGDTGNDAVDVTANTEATVAQGADILALTNSGDTTYNVDDTKANVFGADNSFEAGVQATLNAADNVTVENDVNASQANKLEGLTNSGDLSYELTDTASAINNGIDFVGADAFAQADLITHTGVGLGAHANATGTDGVDDVFEYDVDADSNTTIANFTAGEAGDVLDVSALTPAGTADVVLGVNGGSAAIADGAVLVLTEGWDSDVLTTMNAGIDTTGVVTSTTIILLENAAGTDTLVYLYEDDASAAAIEADEITLIGTLSANGDMTAYHADNFVVA
jgi:hypothetical protein